MRIEMKKVAYLSVFALLLSACEKPETVEPEASWKTFIIKKGEFYTQTLPNILEYDTSFIEFDVKFDSTALYHDVDSVEQQDVNKLYGFTDCWKDIHESSARFGWNCDSSMTGGKTNRINLFAYCYTNSIRAIRYITSVPIDSVINCKISIYQNKYTFTVSTLPKDTIQMTRTCFSTGVVKNVARPYFGGNYPAPHDVSIEIKAY